MTSVARQLLLNATGLVFRGLQWLRYRYCYEKLKSSLRSCGQGAIIEADSSNFVTPATIDVGERSFINCWSHFSGDIRIGSDVLIGPGVMLFSGNHIYAKKGYRAKHCRATLENPEILELLTVEDDVWIGAGSIVLGAVTVGCGSVVGAGSVVTRDVAPFTVTVGNPARPVRRIFSDRNLLEHLMQVDFDPDEAAALVARRARMLEGSAQPPVIEDKDTGSGFYYCWPADAAPRWIPTGSSFP